MTDLPYKIYEASCVRELGNVQLRTGSTLEKAVEALLAAKKLGDVKTTPNHVIVAYKTKAGYEAVFLPKEELFKKFKKEELKEVRL